MTHLRFDMLHHVYSSNSSLEDLRVSALHPQKAMEELGITYRHATPQSIADQWWFWGCDSLPKELPPFLTELNLDPRDFVGRGLSQEDVDRILLKDEKEVICWSCGQGMTYGERADSDGFCPYCGVEIELDD